MRPNCPFSIREVINLNNYKIASGEQPKATLQLVHSDRTKKSHTRYSLKTIGETAVSYEDGYNGGGGGGGMDDLARKVQQLEEAVKEIKQELKEQPSKNDMIILQKDISLELKDLSKNITDNISSKISTLPNEDRMKTIIREQITELKVATEGYVSEKIHEASNKNFRWFFGLGIPGLIAIAVALIKLYIT